MSVLPIISGNLICLKCKPTRTLEVDMISSSGNHLCLYCPNCETNWNFTLIDTNGDIDEQLV